MLLSALASGQAIVIDSVRDELNLQIPDFVVSCDRHVSGWAISTTNDGALDAAMNQLEQALVAGRMNRAYNAQNVRKYMQVADPRLVLHAELYGHIVVSNEISDIGDRKSPKIPDLCASRGVQHADPRDFAEVLGYEFIAQPRP